MNYVSVDFSLNSPGICIFDTVANTHHYISYVKPGLGTKKEQKLQEDIGLLDAAILDALVMAFEVDGTIERIED